MVAVSHDVHVVEIDGGGREGLPALSAYGSRCAAREAREVIDPTRTLPFAFALRVFGSKKKKQGGHRAACLPSRYK